MEPIELTNTRDRMVDTISKFTALANQWGSLEAIRKHTLELIGSLSEILQLDIELKASINEPQSEQEDQTLKLDFQRELAKEAK